MKVWLLSHVDEIDQVSVVSVEAVFSTSAKALAYADTHPLRGRQAIWSVSEYDVDESAPNESVAGEEK